MAGFWRNCLWLVLILAGPAVTGPVWADELAKPTGDVVLQVDGAIGVHNDGSAALFDMAMLEALPKAEIKTNTPWTEGMTTFTGFRLADLLALLEAEGTTLNAHALNDYETVIPADDATRFGIVVAYRVNGVAMPPSDKGPLWIIYPYSAVETLQTETYYSRALWNLDQLTVE